MEDIEINVRQEQKAFSSWKFSGYSIPFYVYQTTLEFRSLHMVDKWVLEKHVLYLYPDCRQSNGRILWPNILLLSSNTAILRTASSGKTT